MYLLPKLGTSEGQTLYFEPWQSDLIIACSYMFLILFSCLLGFGLYNSYRFVYEQGKWKVTPILVFYILAILNILIRLFDITFLAYIAF